MRLIWIFQIMFIIKFTSQDNASLEFIGVYTISSVYNNNVLAHYNNYLQFFREKAQKNQMFKFTKTSNNFFFIELKKEQMKIASNKNGHVEIVINSKSYQYSNSIEWKIIPIDTDIYIIQNI